ncbi:MAG TPA: hypothetical protein VFN23_14720 [Ktedonobacteraceae bacterium]|nr:hypothetical protein [Ktedonobacteraceae bacterium]
MMKQFEGRSLAHPGCLIGVMSGLILGIILAGVLAVYANTPLANLLWMWLGLTVVLGLVGWFIGERLSTPFRLLKRENEVKEVPVTDEYVETQPEASSNISEDML